MKKSAKIALIILTIVAIILGGIFLFLNMVYKSIPQELIYPLSGLSQSIFDSQNMSYVPNEQLTLQHEYAHSPYQFDTVDVDAAKVGNGFVYKLSDTMYTYTTEFTKEDNLEEIIKKELSQAVMIDADSNMSVIENYAFDEGYINGFKADYYVDCLTVSNGQRNGSVYITGYTLTITDTEYDHGYKMFIGVVTAQATTDTFANAKVLLDTLVGTFQFNEDTQNRLVQEEREAARAAELENNVTTNDDIEAQLKEEQKRQETAITTTENSTDLAGQGAVAAGDMDDTTSVQGNSNTVTQALPDNSTATQGDTENIPKYKEMTVNITDAADGVQLYYYYTNVNSEVTVKLFSPDRTKEYAPISTDAGSAMFQIDHMDSGKWIVAISGDYGDCSMKMYRDNQPAQ